MTAAPTSFLGLGMTSEREAEIRDANCNALAEMADLCDPADRAISELLSLVDELREQMADCIANTKTALGLPILPNCFECASWFVDEDGDSSCIKIDPSRGNKNPGASPPDWCPMRRKSIDERQAERAGIVECPECGRERPAVLCSACDAQKDI